MNDANAASRRSQQSSAKYQMRVWHVCLLSVVVAIAIVNIQDQRRTEPALIALAVGGFALYTLLGWAAWRVSQRFRTRLGTVPLIGIYSATMSCLFLAATVVYLFIEHAYLFGI